MSGGKHLAKGSAKPELPDDGLLRLFSMRFCPYAHRVHLMLNFKKLDFHAIYINLMDKPEWLTEYSPLGKVPALQLVKEDGRPSLIESLIIVEYLDEMYPDNPFLPKDPLKRALDRILIERFNVAVISAFYKAIFSEETASLTALSTGLDLFEEELKKRGSDFFNGETPGYADYMIWPWCERCDMLKFLIGDKYELDQTRYERLLKWRDLMLADEVVKSFYLPPETHAKFAKSHRDKKPDYDMLV